MGGRAGTATRFARGDQLGADSCACRETIGLYAQFVKGRASLRFNTRYSSLLLMERRAADNASLFI